MATSNILINGLTPPKLDGAISGSVTLTNADNTGATSWFWEFLDRPAGSASTLSTPTLSSSAFTVDKEGTYLIRLTVNGTISNTATVVTYTALSNFRYPAAYEQTETDPVRGWAADLNAAVRVLELSAKVGQVITAVSLGSVTAGYPVRIAGTSTLPDGTAVPTVSHANAATSATLPAMGIALNSVAGGNKLSVRVGGYCSEVAMNTAAVSVGSPIYVADGGGISTVAGTVEYVVGYVLVSNVSGVIYVSPGINRSAGVVTPSYWTLAGSDIYKNNSGNVGIGTSAPAVALHTFSSASGWIQNHIESTSTAVGSGAALGLKSDGCYSEFAAYGSGYVNTIGGISAASSTSFMGTGSRPPTNMFFGSLGATPIKFVTNNVLRADVATNGNWDFNPTTHTLFVDTVNNRIGVGTNTPGHALHVNSNASTTITASSYGTGVASGLLLRSGRGTDAAPSATQSGDILGYFSAQGHYGGVGLLTTGARIDFTAEENWGSYQGTYMKFSTIDAGTNTLTEKMRLTSTGILGIGTTTPQTGYKLHLNTDGGSTGAIFSAFTNTAAQGSFYNLARGRGTSITSCSAVQSGDLLGQIGFQGVFDNTFAERTVAASITGIAEENFTPTACGANLRFNTQTAGGASGVTEKMRLTSNGALAIGTTTPFAGYKLHISSDVSAGHVATTYSNTAGNGSFFAAARGRGTEASPQPVLAGDLLGFWGVQGIFGSTLAHRNTAGSISIVAEENWSGSATGGYMAFWTHNPGISTGITEKMRLNGAGYLGIGQTNPTSKLDLYEATDAYLAVNLRPSSATKSSAIVCRNEGTGFADIQCYGTTAPNYIFGSSGPLRAGASGFEFNSSTYAFIRSLGNCPLIIGTNDVEMMRLTATGELGIGTTTVEPGTLVNVRKDQDTGTALFVQNRNSGANSKARIDLGYDWDTRYTTYLYDCNTNRAQFSTGAGCTGGFQIGTGTGSNGNIWFTPTGTGKIVFNSISATPYFNLEIVGETRIQGANKLYFGGTGAADNDVNLYRSAADVLKTDDALVSDHLNLTTAEYDDMQVSLLASGVSSLNAPVLTRIMDITGYGTNKGVFAWGFADNREDDLVFSAQLPHSYKEGTDIEFHVHWTMNSASTGTVRWGLEYCWANAGEYLYSTNYGASTTRERSGTTARITFNSYHGMVVGQGISVVDADVAAYNGDYVVTAMNDTNPYWIEYTIASGTEAPTADTDIRVTGFTTKIEATHTLSVASQQRHLITSIGTIKGTRTISNMAVSSILVCRFYRPELAGHIAERIPAMSVDFHHQKDTIGSRSQYTKV